MNQNKSKSIPINESIKLKEFLVIDEKGNNLGLLKRDNALDLAQKKNLDLVLISFKDNVGIAKIMDYSKFKYQQKKKERDNRKNQNIMKSKEIKIKPLINDHDLQTKANNAIHWLEDGDRVVFMIVSMGRMATKTEIIDNVHNKFLNMIGDLGKVIQEKKKINDYKYETIIVPNKKK